MIDIALICQVALCLERRFPKNNSPFSYGTRLCEETGELAELFWKLPSRPSPKKRQELAGEILDILQIIVGVLHAYGLSAALEAKCNLLHKKSRPATLSAQEYLAQFTILGGQFANAINHREGQGVKSQKYSEEADMRLLLHAEEVVRLATQAINQYEIADTLAQCAQKRRQWHYERGFK